MLEARVHNPHTLTYGRKHRPCRPVPVFRRRRDVMGIAGSPVSANLETQRQDKKKGGSRYRRVHREMTRERRRGPKVAAAEGVVGGEAKKELGG